MNKEEIKNEFINCIEGSHTLNLAISILEDREELQQENKQLKERIAYLERSNERKEETIIDYQISEYSILEKLKNWLESDETKSIYTFETGRCFNYRDILNKIKELGEGKK